MFDESTQIIWQHKDNPFQYLLAQTKLSPHAVNKVYLQKPRAYWDRGPSEINKFLKQHLRVCSQNKVCTRLQLRKLTKARLDELAQNSVALQTSELEDSTEKDGDGEAETDLEVKERSDTSKRVRDRGELADRADGYSEEDGEDVFIENS